MVDFVRERLLRAIDCHTKEIAAIDAQIARAGWSSDLQAQRMSELRKNIRLCSELARHERLNRWGRFRVDMTCGGDDIKASITIFATHALHAGATAKRMMAKEEAWAVVNVERVAEEG